MASTNKTSLGLNMWEASDKPVRQDFINDNKIIDERIAKLNSDLTTVFNRIQLVISDCNNPGTTTVNRIYMGRVNNNAANIPVASYYGMLFGIYIDSTQYGVQLFVTMAATPTLHIRSLVTGNWGAWIQK